MLLLKKKNDEYDVLIDNEGDFYSSTMSSSSELVYNSSISLNSNDLLCKE